MACAGCPATRSISASARIRSGWPGCRAQPLRQDLSRLRDLAASGERIGAAQLQGDVGGLARRRRGVHRDRKLTVAGRIGGLRHLQSCFRAQCGLTLGISIDAQAVKAAHAPIDRRRSNRTSTHFIAGPSVALLGRNPDWQSPVAAVRLMMLISEAFSAGSG